MKGPPPHTTPGFRKHLTPAEVATLISAASNTRWAFRDQTMISFCYRHGLRVSELVSLGWSDIDWTGHNIVIMRRKSRKPTPNIHPLAKDEIKALRKLHADYGADSDFVFATERQKAGRFQPFTTAGFAILLRRLEAKTGIHNFGPHALRHGCAQRLADQGQDAFLIRDALGHASVSTSNGYVARSTERLRGVL